MENPTCGILRDQKKNLDMKLKDTVEKLAVSNLQLEELKKELLTTQNKNLHLSILKESYQLSLDNVKELMKSLGCSDQ